MKSTQLFLATLLAYGVLGTSALAQTTDKAGFMGPEAARAKMHLVVQEAIHQANSDSEKSAFQSGQVFVNLFEKDTAVAGVAIPVGSKGNRVFVTFTIDHFRDTAVNVLAREALEDFARTTGSTQPQQSSPQTPEWCKALPRPEYKSLERVLASEPWFEIYKVAPGVFAIYEPHQAEETISYLIVGHKQAVLFDTGMGISDIRRVTTKLTSRPVVVLNSHTHDDHVGGNWQFTFVYGMDTAFTRKNAKGSREDAQAEITPDQLCGDLPKGFNPKTYATKPWKISHAIHDGFKINLGGRTLEVLSTPGHTPDAISLLDRENGLLFTGDTYYPAPIWLYRPETDFDAYVASVKRLAALAPEVKLVLGAHNIPVAEPSVLPRLVTAFESVRAGKVPPQKSEGGKTLYVTDGISFLLKTGAVEAR
jgi:glyoxylase-like metal-dependent hydrolase (beta-lactamase superfamily II)